MMSAIALEAQGFACFWPTDDLFGTLRGNLEFNASGPGGPPTGEVQAREAALSRVLVDRSPVCVITAGR